MHQDLVEISARLASLPPPAELRIGSSPRTPSPILSTTCRACVGGGGSTKEMYVDAPLTQAPATNLGDQLLFADDEFVKGDADAQPPPYANPQSAPGANMYSGTQNVLSVPGITAPNEFQKAVGANALGIGTATGTYVAPPPTMPPPPTIAAQQTTTQKWAPMGMSNTQVLIFTVALCTGCLLLFFIVGMSSGRTPVDPMLTPL